MRPSEDSLTQFLETKYQGQDTRDLPALDNFLRTGFWNPFAKQEERSAAPVSISEHASAASAAAQAAAAAAAAAAASTLDQPVAVAGAVDALPHKQPPPKPVKRARPTDRRIMRRLRLSDELLNDNGKRQSSSSEENCLPNAKRQVRFALFSETQTPTSDTATDAASTPLTPR